MTTEIATPISKTYKTHTSILCAMGHAIDFEEAGGRGDSPFQRELARLKRGEETVWHHASRTCNGAGH